MDCAELVFQCLFIILTSYELLFRKSRDQVTISCIIMDKPVQQGSSIQNELEFIFNHSKTSNYLTIGISLIFCFIFLPFQYFMAGFYLFFSNDYVNAVHKVMNPHQTDIQIPSPDFNRGKLSSFGISCLVDEIY